MAQKKNPENLGFFWTFSLNWVFCLHLRHRGETPPADYNNLLIWAILRPRNEVKPNRHFINRRTRKTVERGDFFPPNFVTDSLGKILESRRKMARKTHRRGQQKVTSYGNVVFYSHIAPFLHGNNAHVICLVDPPKTDTHAKKKTDNKRFRGNLLCSY